MHHSSDVNGTTRFVISNNLLIKQFNVMKLINTHQLDCIFYIIFRLDCILTLIMPMTHQILQLNFLTHHIFDTSQFETLPQMK